MWLRIILLLLTTPLYAADPPMQLYDEGVKQGVIFEVNCTGAGVTCSKSGTRGTVSVAGGGGSGTVTSAGVASPNGTIQLGGTNPITTSGTINADINWTNINGISAINNGGINWFNVNGVAKINTGGINWTNIINQEIQRQAINWNSINAGNLNANGINWTSFSASGFMKFNGSSTPTADTSTYLTAETDPEVGTLTSGNFCKGTGTQTSCTDSNTYLTANQTITLSGDVSGSGSTGITTTIGALKVQSSQVNWANINGLNPINSGGINWFNVNGIGPINTTGVNWTNFPASGFMKFAGQNAPTADTTTYVANTRTLTGGTGIAAIGDLSADRTVTLDLTELSTATLGAGSFTTLTFDAGATDPVLTAASGNLALTTGNLGVGTTTSPNKLYVAGTGEMQGFKMNSSAGSGYILTSNSVGVGTWMPAASSGYTNLTQFVDQNTWKVFYSDGSGDVQELALGASGTFLKSNGASSVPTFATPAGSGDVSKVGTPVDNQVGVWTGDGTIEGDVDLVFNGTNLGIGSATPGAMLDVAGTIRTTGSGDSYFASNIGIGTTIPGGALAVMSGNVGIGTWIPSVLLDVKGTANATTLQQGGVAVVTTARTISTTSPITGGGDLSANRTIAINDAVADGSTKGAASFTANDFDAASGNISLDYTNGQAASASNKGFLTSANWTTFNDAANEWFYTAGVGIGTIAPIGIGTTLGNGALRIMPPSNGLGNGNVGIGTWNPIYSMQMVGNIGIGTANISSGIGIGTFNTSNYWLVTQGNIGIGTGRADGAALTVMGNVGIGTWVNDSGRMVVTGGNVGIGTIRPGTALDITGDIRFSGNLKGLTTTNVGISTTQALNQACDTTCTGPCMWGFDNGTARPTVCSSAISDTCFCMSN